MQETQKTPRELVNDLRRSLKQEMETRQNADQSLKQSLSQLEADFKNALKLINNALDRMDAPPDKEEAPVLKQIQSDLDELYARISNLEHYQHEIFLRLQA